MKAVNAIQLCLIVSILLSVSTIRADLPKSSTTESGVTVYLLPVSGVGQVGIEAIYDVGFIHEPAGMTQAAHLMEHLVCFGATKDYQQKESFKILNGVGMTNAETLADWTHYDYIVPTDQLELALKIEADRLAHLTFDESLIRGEAKRCYLETDAVERNPASGMLKHAMMAFSQAWRYGKTTALVRGGLEDMSVNALEDFHKSYYRPDNLTLVIAGDFDRDEVSRLVEIQLGPIQALPRPDGDGTDWSKVPKRHTVRWDAKVQGVCLAFPPPNDPTDAALLSLIGSQLMQQLYDNAPLKPLTDATFCSSHTWKVGSLPFFVYAAAKEGQRLEEVERVLESEFYRAIRQSAGAVLGIPMMVPHLAAQTTSLDRGVVQNQARMLAQMQRVDEKKAAGMVLAQSALNLGVLHRVLAPQPAATMRNIRRVKPARIRRLIEAHLDEDRMFVTYVIPVGLE